MPWRSLAAEVVRTLERIWSGTPPASPVLVQPLEIVARCSSSYEAVSDLLVRRAMQYLVAQIATILSVEEWAAKVGISRRVLERRFQLSLGRSPHAMIQHERVERAKNLLTTTDLPVSMIAEHCGFQSNERLTVNFRAAVGVPPATYRRDSRVKSSLEIRPK
jgi:LacI family transcriptional regulator